MKLKPWVENSCYPGTHWLLYTDRSDYVGRVDLHPWDGGRYRWQAFMYNEKKRRCGFANNLNEAQKLAQAIVEGKQVQLSLL